MGWRRSRAAMKAQSISLRPGTAALLLGVTPSSRSAWTEWRARGLRSAPSQANWVISGRSLAKVLACGVKSATTSSRVTNSRAMRTSCSWFSIRRKRICCWAISVSRVTDSTSRSISSLRKYQNAEMMAARNSNTEASGPNVASLSWRAGDWRRHQRPINRRRPAMPRLAMPGEWGIMTGLSDRLMAGPCVR